MITGQGHIVNNVNAPQNAAQMFGRLDIIYTDRQTDRQTDRHSLKHHKEGSAERLFSDRYGTGRAAPLRLWTRAKTLFNTFILTF